VLEDRAQVGLVLVAIEDPLVCDDLLDGKVFQPVDLLRLLQQFRSVAAGKEPGLADLDHAAVEAGDLVSRVGARPQGRGVEDERMLEREFHRPSPGLASRPDEQVEV
jgi:hypothetical protein